MNSKVQMFRVGVQIPRRVDLRAETAHPSGGSAGENWFLRVVERPRRSEHRCRLIGSSFSLITNKRPKKVFTSVSGAVVKS